MKTGVDEVADGIYRLSTLEPESELQFNQFLIDDEMPTLIHTGTFPMYEGVRKAVAEVLHPASLPTCSARTSRRASAAAWDALSRRRPRRCWRAAR